MSAVQYAVHLIGMQCGHRTWLLESFTSGVASLIKGREKEKKKKKGKRCCSERGSQSRLRSNPPVIEVVTRSAKSKEYSRPSVALRTWKICRGDRLSQQSQFRRIAKTTQKECSNYAASPTSASKLHRTHSMPVVQNGCPSLFFPPLLMYVHEKSRRRISLPDD